MPFSNFGLDAEILRGIRKAGYTQPTPIQSAAIPEVMLGHDLTAIAKTGTGKTAVFLLPILHHLAHAHRNGGQRRGIKALILVPTRELAVQILENVGSYGRHIPVRAAAIYGGVDEEAQVRALRKGVHIVIATPGRLLHLMDSLKPDFSTLETLVLDEADRMLDMGFLDDIGTIVSGLPVRRQTLMFSATFPKEIESLSKRFLHRPKMIRLGKQTNPAESVEQCVYEVAAHLKSPLLLELLRKPDLRKVLVFARMKDGADRITEFLRNARVKVAKLHSSRSQEQRLKALQDFKDGNVQVLVATDIVSRGIDIDGITHVVNYDMPVNVEDYIHRIGRTGRAAATGEALSFVPEGDLNLLNVIELTIGKRLPRRKLKGFNYHARPLPAAPGEKPAKRDWRKRTREMDATKAAKKTTARKAPTKAARKAGHQPSGGKPVTKPRAGRSPRKSP